MKQIGNPVVDRRGGDEQGARADDELRERAVTVGVGVSEPVSLVDDEEPVGGGTGRQRATRVHAQRLVRHNRRCTVVPSQQGTPLVDQHGGHHQRERVSHLERHRERDVRLAEPDRVGEQGSAVAAEHREKSFCGGDLVRREPRRPCPRRHRSEVEQHPCAERRDGRRRRFRTRAEQAGERLGQGRELLRKDPGRVRPGHGDPGHRADTARRRRRRPPRRAGRLRRARARRPARREAREARAPRAR